MVIRHSNPTDLPQIIDLMKSSLGESLIPKSEPLWIWKHEQNPFGKSFVLVAEENGRLIGLRAFMQWQWKWQGKPYRTIRAVDTATHPAHQGKGIFKKLTLQLLDECKHSGIDFVFNTPNDQSRPGYLKMGWQQQGRMPMKIKLTNILKITERKLFHRSEPTTSNDPTPKPDWQRALQLLSNHSFEPSTSFLETRTSTEYIQWRYANNPLFNYTFFTDYKNYLATARIKLQGKFRELRITDYFRLTEDSRPLDLSKQVKLFCRENDLHFISFSGNQFLHHQRDFRWMGMIPVKPLGPIVTLRNINMNGNFENLLDTKNWNYSIGDLELF